MPKIGDIDKRVHSTKYIWTKCVDCGKERWVYLSKGKPAYIRCHSCASKGKGGRNSVNWKGGKIKCQGYILILIDSASPFFKMKSHQDYIYEHRLVMAKHLGRCLESWEIVHHINGIRDDNRSENLFLINRKEHGELTSKLFRENEKLRRENNRLKKELYL